MRRTKPEPIKPVPRNAIFMVDPLRRRFWEPVPAVPMRTRVGLYDGIPYTRRSRLEGNAQSGKVEVSMQNLLFARSFAAIVTVLILGLAAPGAPAQGQAPKSGGTLTVGFSADSKTLDPTYSVQFGERQVLYLIFNSLVKFGPDFSIRPELAQSWEIRNDGKQLLFKLRSGVTFQDGTPFNATAVKWNIDHRLDPAVASPQRELLAPIIASVEAVDVTTVAFNLKQPSPGLLGLL